MICLSCKKYAMGDLCDVCYTQAEMVSRQAVLDIIKAHKPLCGCDHEPAETQRLHSLMSQLEDEIDELE